VGAQPTDKVHHLLTLIDFLPKKPIPFGTDTKLERKQKTFPMEYFHKHRWALQDDYTADIHHYEKMKQMENIIKSRLEIENEAINE
jgi:hypothetical protein